MKVRDHIIYSALAGAVLFYLFGWPSLLFFLFGFGVDFDHYLYHIFKRRSLSLPKAYRYFIEIEKKREYSRVKGKYFVLHSLELLALLAAASLFYRPALFALAGTLFHYILDWSLELYVLGRPLKRFTVLTSIFKKKRIKESRKKKP